MAWDRPTRAQLRQIARAFFTSRLPGADTTLRRSNITVTADTYAAIADGQYGYMDYMVDAWFVSTAPEEYLVRRGNERNFSRKQATPSAGNVIFSGNDTTPVPAGTVVQDSQQNLFQTTSTVAIAGTTAAAPVQAVAFGSAGNAAANAPLTVTTAIAGINGQAVVDGAGLSGGTDIEDVEVYRARFLTFIQQPPQGGIKSDYEQWALSVPGVTRAWALPKNSGPGTVDVTFVMDGRTNIIPQDADVAAVQAVIDAKRPLPSKGSTVFAPTPWPVDITINGLLPNTDAARTAVQTALADYFSRAAIPGGGLNYDDMDSAIQAATGIAYESLAAPSADISGVPWRIYTLGAIAYTYA